MVECLRHAIRIESPGPHGPGDSSSSFETLTIIAEDVEDDGSDEGYTESGWVAEVYKLSTTPENNMQAGHTDSNTDKLCPRQPHARNKITRETSFIHRISLFGRPLGLLIPSSSVASSLSFVKLSHLRLSAEPTSRHN